MKMNNIFTLLLFLIFIIVSKECKDDEILTNINSCISIEELLRDPSIKLDKMNINYLVRNSKKISKNGYDINFLNLDNKYLQSKNILKSQIYISKSCINSIGKKLNIGSSVGMIMIVSNYNNKNENGIPERFFVIRYSGSGENKYINSTTFDFSICNKDPIVLNTSININEIKVFKKKEKENPKSIDIYELTELDIKKVLYAKKYNIDLFNLHSNFFEDICFKFKSEKNTDVTLETRLLDYYQNITLCDLKLNAQYIKFNYESSNKSLYYCCAYGFYKNEKEKMSYIDKIDSKMNIVFSNSNIKVLSCYKEIIKVKNIYKNYGELICLFVLIMQLIFFITFCCQGTSPLKKQINNLLKSAPKIPPILLQLQKENNINLNSERKKIANDLNANNNESIKNSSNRPSNNINNIPDNNNNNLINLNLNNVKNNTSKRNSINNNIQNASIRSVLGNNFDAESHNEMNIDSKMMASKTEKMRNNMSNPPRKNSKRRSVVLEQKNNELIINDDAGKDTQEKKGNNKKRRKSLNIENKNNTIMIQNLEDLNEEKEEKNTYLPENKDKTSCLPKNNDNNTNLQENKDNKTNKEKEDKEEKQEQIKIQKIIRRRSSQLFELDNDDLNELDFDEAKIFDKRNFCKYYGFMIQISNIIINTFCRCGDFNLFSIKLGLLLFLFPLNLTFNALFFTSKEIQSIYISKLSDITIDWKNLTRSFSSSIISSIILIFLKLLCLTHHSIRKLKKEINIEDARQKSDGLLNCVKLRICIYYIFSLIFLILFGIYVSCFCAVFENTQLLLIETMIFSWILSLLYPFAICFFTAIFRKCSLRNKGNSCCYKINKILQLL